MTYGIRRGSILGENLAANSANSATNRWMSKRKSLCWVCQKDVPVNLGTTSFAGKRIGRLITSNDSLKKFVCFECKPQEK